METAAPAEIVDVPGAGLARMELAKPEKDQPVEPNPLAPREDGAKSKT